MFSSRQSRNGCQYCLLMLNVNVCSFSEGPTHSGVEQYEVMDVDEETAGADGPGPQRCKSIWLFLGQRMSAQLLFEM